LVNFIGEHFKMNVKDLIRKNIVIYDLEIKKPIDECSRGWSSHDEMGISVGCAFDYREMRYRVFMDDNIIKLVDRLNEPGTLVVAFNHIYFDNVLLRAAGLPLKPDTELNNYDMLLVSRAGSGCNDKYAKGFKLDDHLHKLNLPIKTANGALAPLMYKEGRLGELADYCLNDVTVERHLFENMMRTEKTACMYAADAYDIKLPEIRD
jgi:DEAD/DEAH box helicase domain-containing protein